MKSVSVLMATYNGERFLEAQLASLAAQSQLPVELVITDDCSTDATLEIVERFAGTAPFPVKIHVNANRLGWAANFVSGTRLCSGDFIAFCDQDDVWYDSKLETTTALFTSPAVLLACHNAAVVDAQLEKKGTLDRLPANRALYAPLELSPWSNALGFTQILHRSLTSYSEHWGKSIDLDRAPRPMAHDQWFTFLASVLGDMAYTPEPLADYRQHGGNSVGAAAYESGISSLIERTKRSLLAQREASESRERVLHNMLTQAGGPEKGRIEQAHKRYATYSIQLRTRETVYTPASLSTRLGCLVKLVLHRRQLREHGWRYDMKAFVKDLLALLRSHKSPGELGG